MNKLNVNNHIITDSTDTFNQFNNYFCNIDTNLSKLLPSGDCKFQSYLNNSSLNSFVCNSVSQNELYNIIVNLSNTKGSACDSMSNFLIKECKYEFLHPLVHLSRSFLPAEKVRNFGGGLRRKIE